MAGRSRRSSCSRRSRSRPSSSLPAAPSSRKSSGAKTSRCCTRSCRSSSPECTAPSPSRHATRPSKRSSSHRASRRRLASTRASYHPSRPRATPTPTDRDQKSSRSAPRNPLPTAALLRPCRLAAVRVRVPSAPPRPVPRTGPCPLHRVRRLMRIRRRRQLPAAASAHTAARRLTRCRRAFGACGLRRWRRRGVGWGSLGVGRGVRVP